MKQCYFNLVYLLLVMVYSTTLMANDYIIINQVMYDSPMNEQTQHPPFSNGEFIELYNGGENSVSLYGWSLTGDSPSEWYDFPDIAIPSKGFLAIAFRHSSSPSFNLGNVFELPNNTGFQITYQDKIILSNQGETITLYNAHNEIVDQIYYDGTSHVTKPDRLNADNEDGTPGNQCISLHRTWVEFDANGLVVPGTSQWKTNTVSFGSCDVTEPTFGEHTVVGTQSLPSDANFILSLSPLDPTTRVSMNSNGISVSNGVRTKAAIQYYDELGRPNEAISIGVTPAKRDLVQITDYNGLHLATKQWIPVSAQTDGQYVEPSSILETNNRPYEETLYEYSELERVIGHKQPGSAWETHPSSITYALNEESDNVRIYVTMDDVYLHTAAYNYAPYSLYKTIMADEDGKSITTYIDKLGRKIMEERDGHHTYYVYDDFGRLRFVLPHIPLCKLNHGGYPLTDTILQRAAYCYQYDDRGNMIYKRLPGCEPQYMVYDQLGQLVLKQDGNQRLANKWTMCAYDSIGRNLYTAEIKLTQTHEELIAFFADKWQVEHYGNNYSYPLSGTGYASRLLKNKNIRMLTINYYDSYDYMNILPTSIRQALRFSQESGYGLQHDNATGLLTGKRVYDLSEENTYTTISYFYDAKGRVVQSRSAHNTNGRRTATSKEYLFDGSVAQQLTEKGTESNLVREHYRYLYDHAGRVKNIYYQLNNEGEINLSKLSFDTLGRLAQNLLHNERDTITYSYDKRNMLTETNSKHFSERLYYADNLSATPCYNGTISAAYITQTDTAYTFYYTYDVLNRLVELEQDNNGRKEPIERFQYDARGNIMALERYCGPRRMDELTFTYEKEGNRLLSVIDYGADVDRYGIIEYHDLQSEADSVDMRYDANGNLISDKDRGISVIHYNILNLPDTIQFVNGNQIVNLYDAAGRKYKTVIYYNIATVITQHNVIEPYTFETDSVVYTIIDFADNIETVYTAEDTLTQRIHNSTGYKADGLYYHNIKDHLGNICAVIDSEADTLIQSTIYYASGVPMAENLGEDIPPSLYMAMGVQYTENFGRDKQPYLYNGKELIEAHGLNEYDSQARMYYAAIGRTTTLDPLAENYYRVSPYSWCGNNPINYVDPDGRDTLHFDAKGNYTHRVQSEGSHVGLWHKSNNSTREFRFQDPNDANRFMTDEEYLDNISNGGTLDRLDGIMPVSLSSVYKATRPSISDRLKGRYIAALSGKANGSMDYMRVNEPNYNMAGSQSYLMLVDGIPLALQPYNMGNMLWGLKMHRLGFSLPTCLLGAHAYTIYGGMTGKYPKIELDSFDDQCSIILGYMLWPGL